MRNNNKRPRRIRLLELHSVKYSKHRIRRKINEEVKSWASPNFLKTPSLNFFGVSSFSNSSIN